MVSQKDSSLIYLKSYIEDLKLKGVNVPSYIELITINDSLTLIENIKLRKAIYANYLKSHDTNLYVDYVNKERKAMRELLKVEGDEFYSLIYKGALANYDFVFRIQKILKDSIFHVTLTTTRTPSYRFKKYYLAELSDSTELLKLSTETVEYKTLTEGEWLSFISLLYESDFWTLGENIDSGFDGSTWTLLGARKLWESGYQPGYYGIPEYHSVQRWSPGNTTFKKACLRLFELSGKEIVDTY